MSKEKMLKLLKEARPKKTPYDPDDPKNPNNSKPQADPKKPNDPFGTKKRLGKVIKYAAGVIAADVARLAGEKTTGRGRPTKEKAAAKEAKGKGLSKYSDKETDQGIREITLTTKVTTEDGKVKAEKKVIKKGNVDDVPKLKKEFEKELYKKYGYDAEVGVIDHSLGEYDVEGVDYTGRTDPEGGSHTFHAPSKK